MGLLQSADAFYANAALIGVLTATIIAVYSLFYRLLKGRGNGLIKVILSSLVGAVITLLISALIYSVIEHYQEINRPRVLIASGFVVPLVMGLVVGLFHSSTKSVWSSQALLVIVSVLSMDASYRLGILRNPFSFLEQYAYHWNFYRTAETNFTQSPVRYLDEISDIKGIMKKDTRFFSDKYTSYYIKSMIPVYALNPKNHHKRAGYSILPEDIRVLCDTSMPEKVRYGQFMANLKQTQASYVVINRDQYNVNLTRDCVYQLGADLSAYLDENAKQIYAGKILQVYELP